MKKVNTTYWKVFRIEELFDVIKGKRLTKADMIIGKINYIGATAFNNGVTAKIGNSEYIHPAGTITVCYNGSIGQTFYQEEPFWATDDVNVLYPKFKITRNIAQFICPIIYKVSLNYAYVDKWTAEKMRVSKIPLPSTSDGVPDWQYMEDYMRRIEQRTKTAISAFVSSKYSQRKIDTTYWKEFVIEDLFEKLELKFKPKKFIKTKHVSTERTEEFNIPLVNAKHSNNGIMYYGREKDFESEEMTIDIVADGAASTGDVYPQPQRTGVLYNAYLIKLKDKKSSKAVLCFLSTIIERCVKQKFGYDNKCTWDKVKKEKILLPATPAGEPDWRYMEMYMRGVEAITKEKISLLTKKKQEPVQATNITNYGTVNIYEK
jgi:hypothetical protein